MNRAELGKSIYNTSHVEGEFRLRSGRVSKEYFDKYQFESDPQLLHGIAERLSELIPPDTEVLAGLEMGVFQFLLPYHYIQVCHKCWCAKKQNNTEQRS